MNFQMLFYFISISTNPGYLMTTISFMNTSWLFTLCFSILFFYTSPNTIPFWNHSLQIDMAGNIIRLTTKITCIAYPSLDPFAKFSNYSLRDINSHQKYREEKQNGNLKKWLDYLALSVQHGDCIQDCIFFYTM